MYDKSPPSPKELHELPKANAGNLFIGSRHVMDWLSGFPIGFVFKADDVPNWPPNRQRGAISGFLNKAVHKGAVEVIDSEHRRYSFRLLDPGFEGMEKCGKYQGPGGTKGRLAPKRERLFSRKGIQGELPLTNSEISGLTKDYLKTQNLDIETPVYKTQDTQAQDQEISSKILTDCVLGILRNVPEKMIWDELVRREQEWRQNGTLGD